MQHHLLGDGSHLNANIQISFPITHLSPVSASPRKRQKQLGGRVQSLRNDLYSGQLREKYGLSKANRRSRQRSVIPRAQQEQCEQPAVAKRRNLARSTQTARESRASAAPRPRGRARVRACVVLSRLPALPDSVCKRMWEQRESKDDVSEWNNEPFLCQTPIQPTSFQRSRQPLASSEHLVSLVGGGAGGAER